MQEAEEHLDTRRISEEVISFNGVIPAVDAGIHTVRLAVLFYTAGGVGGGERTEACQPNYACGGLKCSIRHGVLQHKPRKTHLLGFLFLCQFMLLCCIWATVMSVL